jgi:hypothetical protein
VYDIVSKTLTQPNVSETETLMGYAKGTTWNPTVSDTGRHMIVGRAMDAMCLEFLFSMCPTLYFHKWLPQQTSVTTTPIGHNTQNVAAVSMVSLFMPPVETEYSSEDDDTRNWWQIDRDTHVGMAFAALQGASSDIHHAQQLSADRYPQSDVWGDPTFLDYIRLIDTRMTCLRRKGGTCAKGLARTAGLETKCTTPW